VARHIRCQLGFLYDALDSGELALYHLPSKFNPASTLTASEDEGRFRRSLAMIAGPRGSASWKKYHSFEHKVSIREKENV
jgi:hypothetical protein